MLPGVAAALGVPVAARRPAGRSAAADRRPAAAPGGSPSCSSTGSAPTCSAPTPPSRPTLAALARPVGRPAAPCPSTTPVSLATLGTGLPPGSHGILGFVTDIPGENRTLNHVQWADDPDPDLWQARPTVFQQPAAAGIPRPPWARTPTAAPASPAPSTAARPIPARSAPATSAPGAGRARRDPAHPRLRLHPELDLTGHVRGVDSPSLARTAASSSTASSSSWSTGCPTTPPSWSPPTTACSTSPPTPASTWQPTRARRRRPACSPANPAPATCTPSPAPPRRPRPRGASARRPGVGGHPGRGGRAAGLFGPWTTPSPPASATSSPSPAARWALVDTGARNRSEPARRLPRLAHRDRAGDPVAARPRAARSAERVSPPGVTCQVARVRRDAWRGRSGGPPSADGRLSTSTTGPSGPSRTTPSARPRRRAGSAPDAPHREVVQAEQPERAPALVLRGLARRRHPGPPAQPRQRHLSRARGPPRFGAVARAPARSRSRAAGRRGWRRTGRRRGGCTPRRRPARAPAAPGPAGARAARSRRRGRRGCTRGRPGRSAGSATEPSHGASSRSASDDRTDHHRPSGPGRLSA